MTYESIKKIYDTSIDQYAKKNRDNKAQELRDQGYQVECYRETNIKGDDVYILRAQKEIESKETTVL